ncbi:plasmid mobilization relaxosome protein MobC [Pseudaminobacter sp. NGMCC 1.201702]|uniref:plasmid mobilization relaxosome protein MobC n=1 Tax=Pseudaminobacter sp. NGMCC 1.201702 TaxID=3391825 RepID=UPI0039F014FF
MTVSAFVRSLSVDRIGVGPVLREGGRGVLRLLADRMHAIGKNCDRIARAIETARGPVEEDLSGAIKNAHIVAATAADELTASTRRSAALRRREGA